jgi:hypothetical protein
MHTAGTICERELGHPAISMGLKQERAYAAPASETWGTRQEHRVPHPYFGCKILVFLRLQAGLRCKIVKTKEFPAKLPRIRSYVKFRSHLAASI